MTTILLVDIESAKLTRLYHAVDRTGSKTLGHTSFRATVDDRMLGEVRATWSANPEIEWVSLDTRAIAPMYFRVPKAVIDNAGLLLDSEELSIVLERRLPPDWYDGIADLL